MKNQFPLTRKQLAKSFGNYTLKDIAYLRLAYKGQNRTQAENLRMTQLLKEEKK